MQLTREKMTRHFRFKVVLKKCSGGFRFPVMESAYKFNIKGSVKKVHGLEYLVVVEGEEANILAFKSWLEQGPFGSPILSLTEEELHVQNLTSFEIVQ